MAKIRFGHVEDLNTLPVFHALEEGLLDFGGKLIKGSLAVLNKMFLAGQLDIASISSIEYARNIDQCLILPDLSVSGDGPIKNALLFSKIPVMELEGKKVCLTDASATSTALLKVLFDHYYHLGANFITMQPDLDKMMAKGDGALLIGDEALRASFRVERENLPYFVTDLGEIWKQFTGEPLVYILWVIRSDFARESPEDVSILHHQLLEAKQQVNSNLTSILEKSRLRSGLPTDVLLKYYKAIENGFTENHQKALLSFYDYCYKSGLIEERIRLAFWGE